METNHHIWRCPVILPRLRAAFLQLAIEADKIIRRDADKLSSCITDSIAYADTFSWAYKDLPPSNEAILLIRSYITHSLFGMFRVHFSTNSGATSVNGIHAYFADYHQDHRLET
ncbi:hypothetical protein RhiirA4_483032 [Rhizophagus irregularis]|uniref:Uncharacterized protein n=1 Tax=Rhizophagus irregularis TaxID=588596 RepID=A0A2I1HM15_9GLOM|nr:hypothetical protein RhiirA4_483032 [Rhizophagus irregularis]